MLKYDNLLFDLEQLMHRTYVEEMRDEFYCRVLFQEDLERDFRNMYFRNAWNLYDN